MTEDLYHAIFRIATALEVPVVVLALLALVVVIIEVGRFLVELIARRRRPSDVVDHGLSDAARRAHAALSAPTPDPAAALAALTPFAWSAAMAKTLAAFVTHAGEPDADTRLAKDLADFDLGRVKRLERTRLLVRAGPALGLMGTLIPLAPALDGLARGDVTTLTQNLRVAFSVTVLGLLVGVVAFALSLVRDRLYAQDYSDLEYVAALLTAPDTEPAPATAAPATATSAPGARAASHIAGGAA